LHKGKTVVDMGKFRLKTVVVAGGCWFTLALEKGSRIGMEPVRGSCLAALLEGFHLEMAVLDDPGPF
jgi:glycine/D-amino acid oxidase-like deaminating enzyme